MIVQIENDNNSSNLPWGKAKGKDRIVQNVKNILNTYKYEVAYNRNLGISPDIIDKDVETMKSIIMEDLFDNIKQYEPRAKLKAVEIKEITSDGAISAAITIEI